MSRTLTWGFRLCKFYIYSIPRQDLAVKSSLVTLGCRAACLVCKSPMIRANLLRLTTLDSIRRGFRSPFCLGEHYFKNHKSLNEGKPRLLSSSKKVMAC